MPKRQSREQKDYQEPGSSLTKSRKTDDINPKASYGKIFNDPIHGPIEVNPLCVAIMDTLQFQRLRYIKQLGTAYFVYPGAAHNRFEHSIGVYYLAGEFIRRLQRNQEDLNIDDDDILCVEIAGLCHDLGHGPFSHVFDGKFIRSEWTHEEGSKEMFDELIRKNPKVKEAHEGFLKDENRVKFIKELIDPPKDLKYKVRQEKPFLYEIVSNKRNGIDVDKWDYFARDCHMLGIKNNFGHVRYMMFARVIDVPGKGRQICMRDKEARHLYDMFHTRANLYRTAYQHKVITGLDSMIVDALDAADDYIEIPGEGGEMRTMTESIGDMEAFTKLNDGIIATIMMSKDERLEKAKGIINRIYNRDIYKCVGESIQSIETEEDKPLTKEDTSKISEQIAAAAGKKDLSILVFIRIFNYGMKSKNPIENIFFYDKKNPEEGSPLTKEQISSMLPERFEERIVTVYAKEKKDAKQIKNGFEKWCKKSKQPRMESPTFFLGSD